MARMAGWLAGEGVVETDCMFKTGWFLLNNRLSRMSGRDYGKSRSLRSALRLCEAISSECVCACVFSFPGLPCAPQRLRGRLMSCVMLCFPLFWPQSSLMLTRAVCAWAGSTSARALARTHTHTTVKVHSYQRLLPVPAE